MVFESQEINSLSGYRGDFGERSFGESISLFSSLLPASGISVLRGIGCNHTVQWCSNLETAPEYLVSESYKKDQQNHHFQQTIDALSTQLSAVQLTLDRIESGQHATRDENLWLHAQLTEQGESLKQQQSDLFKAFLEADRYRSLYEVFRDEKLVNTSRKTVISLPERGRDDDKDDWDGSEPSATDNHVGAKEPVQDSCKSDSSTTSSDKETVASKQVRSKEARPVYRDMIRLFELKFNVSRQTILNWFSKSASALKKLFLVLKAQALEKDSIVNCDETWCRVKMEDKYKKAYIWCMVNKAAGIVIFFYDEGSRGCKVLTDFIGDAELAALQSDAYNVYKYLDDELSEAEHVCCMAHVRARFQKALLQGKSEQDRPFMKWIGRLYDLERGYVNDGPFPNEIKRCRNGSEITEIIASIWMELPRLLDAPLPKSDLLSKALNYLKHSWTSVMAYRHDGRYCIDNSIAERFLRALTVERENKMAFDSHNGAETSSVYHTFTATCKIGALSFYQFLKNYLTAFMEGRTDFGNLTPAILGKIN